MKPQKMFLAASITLSLLILPVSQILAQETGEISTDEQKGGGETSLPPDQKTPKPPISKEERRERFKAKHPNIDEKWEKLTPEQQEKTKRKMKQHRQKQKEALKNMTPEERQAAVQKQKEKRQQFKNTPPAERREKIKGRVKPQSGT